MGRIGSDSVGLDVIVIDETTGTLGSWVDETVIGVRFRLLDLLCLSFCVRHPLSTLVVLVQLHRALARAIT